MTPVGSFVTAFLVTLLVLALVLWSGLAARRALHLVFVFLALLALGSTIWFAERLGETIDVWSAGWITYLHFALAYPAAFGYLLPIATGIWTWRDPARRRLHRHVAFAIVLLTILASVTGTAMVLMADPRQSPT